MVFTWKKIVMASLMVILGLAWATGTFAQTIEDVESYDTSINEGDFDFEMTPENPGPFEDVTIRVSSNLVDANRYPIIWTVDGVTVSQGIGKRSITIKTRNYGQALTVRMSIRLVDSTVEKQVVIAPQDSTILWEAIDSYVPPFYPGKKLPAKEALVRITSIPNFLANKTSSGTKEAVYNWRRNDKVITDAGGYGKDSVLIQHNRVRQNERIDVTSSSVSGSAQAISGVTLSFYDPKILFYNFDAASGLRSPFARNLLSIDGKSLSVEAVPYFFSVINGNPNSLNISWRMNNKDIKLSDARRKTMITLQNPGTTGAATIETVVENTARMFQSAGASLSVVFKKS